MHNLLNFSSRNLNLIFKVSVLPGAKLHDLAMKTITELSYCDLCHYQLVILAGGINNMSKLVYRPTRHAIPRYRSSESLVNYTLSELEKAVGKITSFFDIPVAVASLSGIDLVNYSPLYYGKLYTMQPQIDHAIVDLNRLIRGLNRRNGVRTPDLSSDVHRCSGNGGRYRTHYIHLFDGLHPGYPLRKRWTEKLISYCVRMSGDRYHNQDRPDSDYWWDPAYDLY